MDSLILSPHSAEAQEMLRNIELIYTDLDGTMLAPGGRLFVNHDGQPSNQLGEALSKLKAAGVEVVLVTGRTRSSLAEMIRLMDLSGFMGEIGTVSQRGLGYTGKHKFHTGEMPYDPNCNKTPYQIIDESGIVDKLIAAFPGFLEYSPSAFREVSHLLRGRVNLEEAQAILDKGKLPLVITDNGRINSLPGPCSLAIDKDVHIYHIMPKGCSKAVAVRADILDRGIDKSKTLAIGDALTDVQMGLETRAFVTVQNGLKSAAVVNEISKNNRPVIATVKPTIDGWCECAQAILEAKGLSS